MSIRIPWNPSPSLPLPSLSIRHAGRLKLALDKFIYLMNSWNGVDVTQLLPLTMNLHLTHPMITVCWSRLVISACSESDDIYTTIGEPSSKFAEFLAVQSQFDSDHDFDFSTPTSCQSTTFVRPLFAFYCTLLYYENKKKIMRNFVTDTAMFTLRDCWICVIDKLRCANDGATALRQISR